mgnify:CR=1 FL=1
MGKSDGRIWKAERKVRASFDVKTGQRTFYTNAEAETTGIFRASEARDGMAMAMAWTGPLFVGCSGRSVSWFGTDTCEIRLKAHLRRS